MSSSTEDNRYIVKFLCSSLGAGCIIGKKGSNTSRLQEDYSTTIRVSNSYETFPETNERIVLVSCKTLDGLLDAFWAIAPFAFNKGEEITGTLNIRLIIPAQVVGLLIGKNGSTIFSIKEKSGAFVSVSVRDAHVASSDRLVTISGHVDKVKQAVKMILTLLTADENYNLMSWPFTKAEVAPSISSLIDTTLSRASLPLSPRSAALAKRRSLASASVVDDIAASLLNLEISSRRDSTSRSGSISSGGRKSISLPSPSVEFHECTFPVPNQFVRVLVGLNGENIDAMERKCHVRISVSKKGDVNEANERQVTVIGELSNCMLAHSQISQMIREEMESHIRAPTITRKGSLLSC